MRNHPTPQACRAVAAQLRRAVDKYPGMKLDMDEGKVRAYGHPCGTVHCHAGAYLLGDPDFEDKFSQFGPVGYDLGVDALAKILGFPDHLMLTQWADSNPSLWGSQEGLDMFAHKSAFNGAESVSEIADWWDAVANRIEAHNKEEVSV